MTSDSAADSSARTLAREYAEVVVYRDGIRQGLVGFQQQMQRHPSLTPTQMVELFRSILLDGTHPRLWNAGYLLGWMYAYQQRYDLSWLTLPPLVRTQQRLQQEVARLLEHVRQGELTLREAAALIEQERQERADEP